jgi:hemoglobin-like flavoprotein
VNDLVTTTLELAAERDLDITTPVYQRYFARCSDSQALMRYVDDTVRGRMLQEVLRLLLLEDVTVDADYLRFETRTHTGYGVTPTMYPPLLGAVRDAVREVLADEWTEAMAAAWDARIERLLAAIEAARLASAAPC